MCFNMCVLLSFQNKTFTCEGVFLRNGVATFTYRRFKLDDLTFHLTVVM